MRIGINLLYMLPGVVGGTETYAAGLLRGLACVNQEDKFIIFLNKESEQWPIPKADNFSSVVCSVWAKNRFWRYLFEQVFLPFLLIRHKIDLIHSLGYVGPLFSPCHRVVTIHDLNIIGHKDNMPLIKRLVLGFFVKRIAQRVDHLITVSEFSKKEIHRHLNVPLHKITVTHEAVREDIDNINITWNNVRSHYAIEKPYIIAFSSQSHHKNIPRLIESFSKIALRVPHSLVLIGHIPRDGLVQSAINKTGLHSRIVAIGYVPQEYVMPLIMNADLFIFPSLYEGFGLPILEAQRAGVCVACSNISSLPEVAGEGALLFDPNSVESMTQALFQCLQDSSLRSVLVQKGRANIERFSWQKTAAQTLEVYQRVTKSNEPF